VISINNKVHYYSDQIKDDGMGRTCSKQGMNEKRIQNFNLKTWRRRRWKECV